MSTTPVPGVSRRPLTRLLAAAVVVALVVGLGFGVRWWRHPHVFEGRSGMDGAFATRSEPYLASFGVVFPRVDGDGEEELTLRGWRPVLAVGSAPAELTLVRCRYRDMPIGSVTGPLGRWCSSAAPVREGMRYRVGRDSRDTLVLSVRPRGSGTVRVRGVDLDYARGARHLWQRGTERLSISVDVPIR